LHCQFASIIQVKTRVIIITFAKPTQKWKSCLKICNLAGNQQEGKNRIRLLTSFHSLSVLFVSGSAYDKIEPNLKGGLRLGEI